MSQDHLARRESWRSSRCHFHLPTYIAFNSNHLSSHQQRDLRLTAGMIRRRKRTSSDLSWALERTWSVTSIHVILTTTYFITPNEKTKGLTITKLLPNLSLLQVLQLGAPKHQAVQGDWQETTTARPLQFWQLIEQELLEIHRNQCPKKYVHKAT